MTTETLDLIHNSEYKISSVKNQKINRPFDSFGTDPHKKGFTSIYDVLEQLNPSDLKLFCMLARVRDYNTNESVLIRKNLISKEKTALNRGYQTLESLNLIIRVRAETYLFNPDYLIPKTQNIAKITERYKQEKEALNADLVLEVEE